MKSILTIPCHWDKKVILSIVKSKYKDTGIEPGEIYGALARSPLGHGRASNSVPNVSKTKALEFRVFVEKRGLKFNYLINAPLPYKYQKSYDQESENYLKWVLRVLKPDSVTVSSIKTIKEIRRIDNKIKINISTIAGVKTINDLNPYIEMKINRVVPHHDIGKDIYKLKELIKFCNKRKIDVELLATESCLFKCPNREAHYRYLVEENHDKQFHSNCNYRKICNPSEFLLAGGTIRPEDMVFYEKLGVKYFKITGRSKPPNWLPEVVDAYLNRKYNGNLIRLLGADPKLELEKWVYIDNSALNGFLQKFPFKKSEKIRKKYCNRVIQKLYEEDKFYLCDGSMYIFKNGDFFLDKPGEIVREKLINR